MENKKVDLLEKLYNFLKDEYIKNEQCDEMVEFKKIIEEEKNKEKEKNNIYDNKQNLKFMNRVYFVLYILVFVLVIYNIYQIFMFL